MPDSRPAGTPFKRLNHVLATVVEACIDGRRKAREGINHRQHPDLAAYGQLIMNEIHCPNLIGMSCLRAVSVKLGFDATLGNLIAKLEIHLLVKTINSLCINGPSVALEQDVNTAVAIAHPRLADVLDPQLQSGLLAASGLVDIKRPIDLQYRTGASDRDLPVCLDRVDKLAFASRPQSFLTGRPEASPCPMRDQRRSASAWRSRPQAAEAASSPRASDRRIFAPIVKRCV